MDQERARQELIKLYADIVQRETASGTAETLARARAAGVFIGLLAELAHDDSRNWTVIRRRIDLLRLRKNP